MLWIIFKKPLFFPLVVCILLAGKIYAGDGSVGTTSSTTSTISISKVSGVQISGFEDILFGSVNSVPGTYYFDVCVFSSTGSYTVQA
ncbi:MAG: hypothetical protein KBD63_07710, partial [Bacteriovoracaceae bacterium]|nr:hypothetical protein [Bacteriovoracaceae bacterium]